MFRFENVVVKYTKESVFISHWKPEYDKCSFNSVKNTLMCCHPDAWQQIAYRSFIDETGDSFWHICDGLEGGEQEIDAVCVKVDEVILARNAAENQRKS